jgi:hypothetical protein
MDKTKRTMHLQKKNYIKVISQSLKYLWKKAIPSNALTFISWLTKSNKGLAKKFEHVDTWKTKVIDIAASDFETANFTKPDQSGEQP